MQFSGFPNAWNLKNRAPVQAGAQFLQSRVWAFAVQKYQTNVEKPVDFEIQTLKKLIKIPL